MQTKSGAPGAPPGAVEERRKEPRKNKPFFVGYSVDGVAFLPAYGLEISRSGVRLLAEAVMPDADFRVRIMLNKRDFIVDLKKIWEQQVPRDDQIWTMTGTKFVMIGHIDREFIESYVEEKPFYEGNKLLEQLDELRKRPDKADRILPQELLDEFLARLVKLERLAPLAPNESPLVKFRYDGPRQKNGQRVHLITIQSKTVKDGKISPFVTRFIFDDHGKHVEILGNTV